jgi:hypothetical protein
LALGPANFVIKIGDKTVVTAKLSLDFNHFPSILSEMLVGGIGDVTNNYTWKLRIRARSASRTIAGW